jgi:hypothetical protein
MRLSLLATAFGLIVGSVCYAQTQTPPNSPPVGRPDFTGTWQIDRSISNDPQQTTFEPSPDRARQNSGSGYRRRGGFGGGGSGSGGSRPDSQSSAESSMSPDERARLQALVDMLRTASATLVISHHEPSFVVNDAKNQTQFFKTDGSGEENHLGAATLSSSTHWEVSRVVTTYTLSDRQRLVFTYTLLPATEQLVLRVHRDATDGQRTGTAELKLVYSLSPAPTR